MYTLGSLRTLVLSWLDDPAATYFTPSQVNVWLNNGQREVQKQLIQAGENYYVSQSTTNCVVNQDTYQVPTSFLKVNKFELVLSPIPQTQTTGTAFVSESRRTLMPVTLVQLDLVSTSAGVPTNYCLRKNAFVLRNVPDNTYTLRLCWTYLVADMTTDTASPDVPLSYQEYIAVLATIDGFLKDGRDPSAMLAKKNYYLELMKQDAENRTVDKPRSVVVTEGDSYWSGF